MTEHDAARPWLVVGDVQHLTAELEDDVDFFEWAAKQWPGVALRILAGAIAAAAAKQRPHRLSQRVISGPLDPPGP